MDPKELQDLKVPQDLMYESILHFISQSLPFYIFNFKAQGCLKNKEMYFFIY